MQGKDKRETGIFQSLMCLSWMLALDEDGRSQDTALAGSIKLWESKIQQKVLNFDRVTVNKPI